MLNVTNAYKELIKSSIRPKCKPVIKVSGIDNNGDDIELIWDANSIENFSYKRSIDMFGRELPVMELTWKERYVGKLTQEMFPEKYNNITKYMAVELSFIQDLNFYNTWKTLFDTSATWKTLFDTSATWKDLKTKVKTEKIIFPTLYLSAKPTIKGQTVTWVARDILYFLQENQVKTFSPNISFINPMRFFILNERGNFLNAQAMFEGLSYTDEQFKNSIDEDIVLESRIIFGGSTKNLLVDYSQLKNKYIDFVGKGATLKDIMNTDFSGVVFYSKTMKEYPQIEKMSNISTFSFKSYSWMSDYSKSYTVDYTKVYKILGGNIYRYNFDGYGTTNSGLPHEINFALTTDEDFGAIEVLPVGWVEQENSLSSGKIGEVFTENNSLNIYDDKTLEASNRFVRLNQYFNTNAMVLQFNTLPNLAMETGDLVNVETNLYSEYTGNLIASGWIVALELNYTGTLWEKIIVHTL